MSAFLRLVQEFFGDLRRQKMRAFLTTLSVAVGTFSVTMLLSFGQGLEERMMRGELGSGDMILHLYGGTTSRIFQGLPKGRAIRLHQEDAALLQRSIPEIALAGPCYGSRFPVERGRISTTDCYTVGVSPEFEIMRRFFPLSGRFIDRKDVQERRRVAFLGYEIARRLFGAEDPVGKQIKIGGIPFLVIGVMQNKFQTSMSNGPDVRRVVIPYTTFHVIWPWRRLWYLSVRPRVPELHKYVSRRIYSVLGQKYRFAPEDSRALNIWDYIENWQMLRKVFLAVKIFLGAVGVTTLLIAGVGIANIMYVVVRERTFEIGVKRAIGARRKDILRQFLLESLLLPE